MILHSNTLIFDNIKNLITEIINLLSDKKMMRLLGMSVYDLKPPLCCRTLKKMGIQCRLKCYFGKQLNKIYYS